MTAFHQQLKKIWIRRFAIAAGLLYSVMSATYAAEDVRYAPILPQQNPEAAFRVDQQLRSALNQNGAPVNEAIIDNVVGIVFVDVPERVNPISPNRPGISIQEPAQFAFSQWPEFKAEMTQFLGKPLTRTTFEDLEKRIKKIYSNHSITFVGVSIPLQNADSGTLQILLQEGRVNSVSVSGANYFDNQKLSQNLWVKPDRYLDANDLREDLRWLSQNPFREADFDMKPSETPNEIDIEYKIKDQLPFRGTVGYTDTGTRSTCLERVFMGTTYGNLLNTSSLLSYQLSASPDFKTLVNHSTSLVIPFAKTRNSLIINGSYATLEPDANQEGMHWSSGFMFNRRLWTRAEEEYYRTANWHFGFDFLHTNTNLDYGGDSVYGIPVETAQFTLGFDWVNICKSGYISFDAGLHVSPGGFSKYNNDEFFQAFSGTDARSDYLFATTELDMLRHCSQADVRCRLFGQISNAYLITYDQLGIGGVGSVRGYDSYTENADGGFIMNLEVLTPSQKHKGSWLQNVPPYRRLDKCYEEDLQLLAFFDLGVGVNWAEEDEDHETVTLAGTGVGVRYSFGPWVSLDACYGFQLLEPESEKPMTGRPHIRLVICR